MAGQEGICEGPVIHLTVSQDGSGDYTTLTGALRALDDMEGETIGPAHLFIKRGIYRERLEIKLPWLTLEGESADGTVITGGLYARMVLEDGKKRGTFRTYSVLVDTHDFTARNLTFENSAGPGDRVGQALALYVDGDRILFEGCRMRGGQDTLFTGPLPPKELQKDGFVGPKQYAPRISGRHCYRDCLIRGDIDFIFGGAAAFFERCELCSTGCTRERKGYVTAASTPRGQEYGYVFKDCRFTGDCPQESVYLGRPWRNYAKTVLIGCFMGPHICREGWHDWGKTEARETLYYGEWGSFGPGAGDAIRPDWVHILTRQQADEYTCKKVLGGEDGWTP